MSGARAAGRRAAKTLTLVTGGAGFIGTNLCERLLAEGGHVVIFDNLSRAGVEHNLRWLRNRHGPELRVEIGDVRDAAAVARAIRGVDRVYHFAAQVAVTTSLVDPVQDFEINARGTLNVLEALRARPDRVPLVFTSTNKVYGQLADVSLESTSSRYRPADGSAGFDEKRRLSFHSPYGCSKGAADQYVIDYTHTYAIPATVLRMSCIYGPHQFGNEDQGWVAHFILRALRGEPITIYGDGRQVRDILFVDDLVEALLLAGEPQPDLRGQAFNLGGGPANTISLLELIEVLGRMRGAPLPVQYAEWRAADQRYYVSEPSLFSSLTGWQPRVGVEAGVRTLWHWLARYRAHPDPLASSVLNGDADLRLPTVSVAAS